jgi:anti-sigma regulatory factor (Ser/Thr protein kinase)
VGGSFDHEAVLYRGEDGFLAGTLPFVREGLEQDEAVLVAVSRRKARLLADRLVGMAGRVKFVDMLELGRNPARIIPVWRDFAADNAARGRPFRGVGEPVWSERSADELDECRRHEALLNVAFDDGPAWRLLCPYDVATLPPAAVDVAHHTHPHVRGNGSAARASAAYGGEVDQLDGALPAPPARRRDIAFTDENLGAVRTAVGRASRWAGLNRERAADLMLAVSELATNSLRHAGGRGRFRLWRDSDAIVCEVSDAGRIEDALVGRYTPSIGQGSERGLWLVNQLCDLTQIRSTADGTTVRIHMGLPDRAAALEVPVAATA